MLVEPPELPLPGAPNDPRRAALAAVIDELDRLGVPSRRQTILVAGGLNRRAGQRELEALLEPSSARRFRGRVEVHDAEAPDLLHLGDGGRTPLRVNRHVAETDLVVSVTAAETVLNGGAGRAARRLRAGDDPRGERLLAARDGRLPRLAARP